MFNGKKDWDLYAHIAQDEPGKEHTAVQTLKSICDNPNYSTYRYGDKQPDEAKGGVIATYRDDDNQLMITKLNYLCHRLIVASPGSAKTQGAILGELHNADGANSYIVYDVKGEITERSYSYLVEKYGKDKVLIANYMQPEYSQIRINPFQRFAEEWLDAEKLNEKEKKSVRDKIRTNVRKLIHTFCPIGGHKEPMWEETARNFIYAIFIGIIEDLTLSDSEAEKTKRIRTTHDQINFGTAIKIFGQFSWTRSDFDDKGFFTSRRHDSSVAYQYSKAILQETTSTRSNYMNFVDRYLQRFEDPKLQAMSERNDLNIGKIAESPHVLFIVYDNSDEAQLEWVSTMSACILSELLEISHKTAKPLPTTVSVLIDEFSSLKPHNIYPTVLATGRGSNIFLTLVLQSYGQLQSKYKDDCVAMIDNCGVQMFLGSSDVNSARIFSEKIGMTTVPCPSAYLSTGSYGSETVPAVSVDTLMHRMKLGESYICLLRDMPIHGNFELYFRTPEYLQYPMISNDSHRLLYETSTYAEYDPPCFHEDEDDDDDDFFKMPDIKIKAAPKKRRSKRGDVRYAERSKATLGSSAKNTIIPSVEETHKEDIVMRPVISEELLYKEVNSSPETEWVYETTEEFEDKVMTVIEAIIMRDINQDRMGAIEVVKVWIERTSAPDRKQVYERTLHEFEIASNTEYDILKKQLFS